MLLYTVNHPYRYESEKICRIYFPTEKIVFASDVPDAPEDGKTVYTEIAEEDGTLTFLCRADIDGKSGEYSFSHPVPETDRDPECEKLLAKAITRVLTEITGIVPPWGILTGVRPSKLMRKYIREKGEDGAQSLFTDFLQVTKEKTKLAFHVAQAENDCIELSVPRSFSLYVSIPFCPTRCSYCSFVSHSVEQAKKLIPDYVRLLCRELEETAKIANDLGLRLETVYIGGGTPTSLSAEDLAQITGTVVRCFDMQNAREFTVEAGRPDTIDRQKLITLKNAGVTRISINPQTFSDEVLNNIGRRHSAADILEKFALARQLGFDNINMDLIAGLPGDTPAGFRDTLGRAISLSPENITVHTLALKRSASLVTAAETDSVCKKTEEMLNFAVETLYKNDFFPYYMYRQSKSVGNLENVGWSRPGRFCLYNIYMMEEIHTVLAAGGGAVTKLRDPFSDDIERIYNFKYPYEYIGRFEEQAERKKRIADFYNTKFI